MRAITHEIIENVEYLETTEGDVIACVGLENILGVLCRRGFLTDLQAKRVLRIAL